MVIRQLKTVTPFMATFERLTKRVTLIGIALLWQRRTLCSSASHFAASRHGGRPSASISGESCQGSVQNVRI